MDPTVAAELELVEEEFSNSLLDFLLQFVRSHCDQILVSFAVAELHAIGIQVHPLLVVQLGPLLLPSVEHCDARVGLYLSVWILQDVTCIRPRVVVVFLLVRIVRMAKTRRRRPSDMAAAPGPSNIARAAEYSLAGMGRARLSSRKTGRKTNAWRANRRIIFEEQ